LYFVYQFRNAMNTTKIAIAIFLASSTALVGIAMVPSLTNEVYAHQCLLPNTGNTAFPGQTPLTGNCPSGNQPLQSQGQGTATGLIGQAQNNNPTNFYCAEALQATGQSSACPFP
jgi:hypothetical protein